jgi:SAM-dependent methyltransferase
MNRMERPEIWGTLKDAPDIREKIRVFEEVIPDDVDTILDVGCGDGAITNALGRRWTVTGVDSSSAALRHVTTEAVLGDARSLPFADGSFDLVMSSQMLEHLDDESYADALSELRRITRAYLLISVPFREDLGSRMIRCPRCGLQQHVWGHLRGFTPESLIHDLTDFEARDVRTFGDLQPPAWPAPLLWVMHNIYGSWYPPEGQHAQCARCGNTDFGAMRTSRPFLGLVKRAIDRIGFRSGYPFWLAVLARRQLPGQRDQSDRPPWRLARGQVGGSVAGERVREPR